jgi:N-acetylneuraminate synthase
MGRNGAHIRIGHHDIGIDQPPFVIAELSGNHNQSLDRAVRLVEAAARAGVHAVKLQTYTADTLTIEADTGSFYIQDAGNLWQGQTLYDLYKKAFTPWEWHEPLFKRCQELGVVAFSTPFDESAVDFLETLNVPAYKIASFENNHLSLIHKVAATGKPMIISTGMATIADLDEAIKTARDGGCRDIILLKCTSSYPASPSDSNLLTIPHLRELFDTEMGLSDHTLGVGVAIASVALGATVIEKHFTISRSEGGVDSAFSMEPEEMKTLVQESLKAWQALGQVHYGLTEREKSSVRFRRSIYIVEDIGEGETFSSSNIRIIRPGEGLSPKYFDILIGKKASRAIKRGTPMRWDLLG